MQIPRQAHQVIRGREKVNAAATEMAGLARLASELGESSPLNGTTILGCVTPTPETGVLIMTLRELGAEVSWCSDNQFGADDDVVAFLDSLGIPVFARADMSEHDYFGCMEKAASQCERAERMQIVDDGSDITCFLADRRAKQLERVGGISEQTTCGITMIRHLYEAGRLPAPTINVNDCFTKKHFDNYYGVQDSLIQALTTSMRLHLAGQLATVFGYGPVGKGAAVALRRAGAVVQVVEADLLRLMQAQFDGFLPTDLASALRTSRICVTATGCVMTIPGSALELAADGLVLCNIGHGDKEYDTPYLRSLGTESRVNRYVDSYTLRSGASVFSLCKGALANLIAGGGNRPAVMSLTFCLQALAQLDLVTHPERYSEARLYPLRLELEHRSAELNYPELPAKVYSLTPSQREYLA